MFGKYIYIVLVLFLIVIQANAQFKPEELSSGNSIDGKKQSDEDAKKAEKKKPKIPSMIKTWELKDHGATIKPSELDTALGFFHIYNPLEQRSFSNIFTGNIGGAYLSNDFFRRTPNTDFYFARSFDAYFLFPSQINYFNTTTPYSLLDYTQSENKSSKNETRFNVFHSQNVDENFNFEFIYNQTKSQGQYSSQVNKFHNIGIGTSYQSDQFTSHSNLLFNRLQAQENGGVELESGKVLGDYEDTEDLTVKMDDAYNYLQNNNFFTVNEYRVGKTIPADSAEYVVDIFIPRVGFIHELEFSDNKRKFIKDDAQSGFFKNIFLDSLSTNDSIKYKRLTNIFQIKFYEAPDRKYTFGKRAYIGFDKLWYHFSSDSVYYPEAKAFYYPKKQSNIFVGGGIFRNEGKFWQWEANGKIYLAGYRSGQTELNGFINKPLKIGSDTTSLRVEGSLKTMVPDYFEHYYFSNHFEWVNNFNNIKEMTLRASIHSQQYKATIGAGYSLLSNFIYNNEDALPAQAKSEFLILSAHLDKNFESKHWLVRTQLLLQKASNDSYIHLPTFTGFLSLNYRTLWSKVMYTQLGIDTRYYTSYYADAYEPGTSRFYLQNTQKTGNYPFVDLHVNLKLKRTRFYFKLMNALSGFAGNNYFLVPDYPYYRRTYRIGVAWSFYD